MCNFQFKGVCLRCEGKLSHCFMYWWKVYFLPWMLKKIMFCLECMKLFSGIIKKCMKCFAKSRNSVGCSADWEKSRHCSWMLNCCHLSGAWRRRALWCALSPFADGHVAALSPGPGVSCARCSLLVAIQWHPPSCCELHGSDYKGAKLPGATFMPSNIDRLSHFIPAMDPAGVEDPEHTNGKEEVGFVYILCSWGNGRIHCNPSASSIYFTYIRAVFDSLSASYLFFTFLFCFSL